MGRLRVQNWIFDAEYKQRTRLKSIISFTYRPSTRPLVIAKVTVLYRFSWVAITTTDHFHISQEYWINHSSSMMHLCSNSMTVVVVVAVAYSARELFSSDFKWYITASYQTIYNQFGKDSLCCACDRNDLFPVAQRAQYTRAFNCWKQISSETNLSSLSIAQRFSLGRIFCEVKIVGLKGTW